MENGGEVLKIPPIENPGFKQGREWGKTHQPEVDRVISDFTHEDAKAVFIVGAIHSGKTSLALATASALQDRKETPYQTYFTTPAVQEVPLAKPVVDERTGTRYDKLPDAEQLKASGQPVLIVLDEASVRGPGPESSSTWQPYIDAPNVKFIVLGQRIEKPLQGWKDLFPDQSKVIVEQLKI